METLLGVFVGIGLSAACGFRVFVPMLGISIASMSGHLDLAYGFQWIGSPVALVAFSVATALEIGTYYVPWLDNLMDTIATPAAVVAGIIVTASVVSDMSPFLKWTLAVIAGGGVAAVVQGGTVLVRTASAAATGGVGNPLLATAENGGAILGTLLALVLPVAAAILALALCAWMLRRILKWFAAGKPAAAEAKPEPRPEAGPGSTGA